MSINCLTEEKFYDDINFNRYRRNNRSVSPSGQSFHEFKSNMFGNYDQFKENKSRSRTPEYTPNQKNQEQTSKLRQINQIMKDNITPNNNKYDEQINSISPIKRCPTLDEFNKCQNAREKKQLMFSSSNFDNLPKYKNNNKNKEPLLSATAKTFEQKILYDNRKLTPFDTRKMLQASHIQMGEHCDQQNQFYEHSSVPRNYDEKLNNPYNEIKQRNMQQSDIFGTGLGSQQQKLNCNNRSKSTFMERGEPEKDKDYVDVLHKNQNEKPFMKQLDFLESDKRNDFNQWDMRPKSKITYSYKNLPEKEENEVRNLIQNKNIKKEFREDKNRTIQNKISSMDSKSINQNYQNKSDESRIFNIEISNFAQNQSINDLKRKLHQFHIAKIELPNYNFMTGTHDGVAKTKIRLNKNQEKEFLKVLNENKLISKEYSDQVGNGRNDHYTKLIKDYRKLLQTNQINDKTDNQRNKFNSSQHYIKNQSSHTDLISGSKNMQKQYDNWMEQFSGDKSPRIRAKKYDDNRRSSKKVNPNKNNTKK